MKGSDYLDQVEPIAADKTGRIIPATTLRRMPIALDNALTERPVRVHGDFLYADSDSTGKATLKLNNTSEDPMPFIAQSMVEGLPIKDVFITCTAQPGLVLNLWYGYRARFRPPQALTDISDRPGRLIGRVGMLFDRNPIGKAVNGGTFAAAPHGLTARWSYTVPTARKFALEAWYLRQYRNTAAAPVSEWRTSIEISPLGSGFFPFQDLATIRNAVGDGDGDNVSGATILLATDQLRGTDQDGSTGGTTSQSSGHKGTEFDA